jgi:hypothetical protein
VTLPRQGEDKLQGTFTAKNGRQFPISLTKLQRSTEFDGKWVGRAIPSRSSYATGEYDIVVKHSEITGSVTFSNYGRVWISTVEGEIYSNNIAGVRLRPYSNPAGESNSRGSEFTGAFERDEFKGTDDNGGALIYQVTLRKK